MLRVTIELVPGGAEAQARTIGVVEIANVGGTMTKGNYLVLLMKDPKGKSVAKQVWRRALMKTPPEIGDDVIRGEVSGFERQRRGPYDLLWLALKACGIADRNADAFALPQAVARPLSDDERMEEKDVLS